MNRLSAATWLVAERRYDEVGIRLRDLPDLLSLAEQGFDYEREVEYKAGLEPVKRARLAHEADGSRMEELLAWLRQHPRSSGSVVERGVGRWAREMLIVALERGLAGYEEGPRRSRLWSANPAQPARPRGTP